MSDQAMVERQCSRQVGSSIPSQPAVSAHSVPHSNPAEHKLLDPPPPNLKKVIVRRKPPKGRCCLLRPVGLTMHAPQTAVRVGRQSGAPGLPHIMGLGLAASRLMRACV